MPTLFSNYSSLLHIAIDRVLLVIEEKYVVVLEEKKGSNDLCFITAYTATVNYIQNVIKKDSSLLRDKNSPSLNGD